MITALSALPWDVKRRVHALEAMHILARCHEDQPWEDKAQHLFQFIARMANSGYPAQYRADTIRSALTGHTTSEPELHREGGQFTDQTLMTGLREPREIYGRDKLCIEGESTALPCLYPPPLGQPWQS